MPDLPQRLAARLSDRRRAVGRPRKDAIACAVLIPMMPTAEPAAPGEYEVLYTLRSEHLPSHKGQVAFPGGKRHGDEELLQTALRESAEEVGVDPRDVQVLGCLDDVDTMAGQFVITPWLGLLPAGYRFEANPREVADLFRVTLSALADPRHHALTRRSWGGNHYELPAITAGPHEIWGVTHQITLDLLQVIRDCRGA